MLRSLHRWAVRRRFKAMVADFDNRIAEARAKHQPVRELERAKSAWVHQCLAGPAGFKSAGPMAGDRR